MQLNAEEIDELFKWMLSILQPTTATQQFLPVNFLRQFDQSRAGPLDQTEPEPGSCLPGILIYSIYYGYLPRWARLMQLTCAWAELARRREGGREGGRRAGGVGVGDRRTWRRLLGGHLLYATKNISRLCGSGREKLNSFPTSEMMDFNVRVGESVVMLYRCFAAASGPANAAAPAAACSVLLPLPPLLLPLLLLKPPIECPLLLCCPCRRCLSAPLFVVDSDSK